MLADDADSYMSGPRLNLDLDGVNNTSELHGSEIRIHLNGEGQEFVANSRADEPQITATQNQVLNPGVRLLNDLFKRGMVISAMELPVRDSGKLNLNDEIEETLSQFDSDPNFAHFLVRVRRTRGDLNIATKSQDNYVEPVADTFVSTTLAFEDLVDQTLEINSAQSLPAVELESVNSSSPASTASASAPSVMSLKVDATTDQAQAPAIETAANTVGDNSSDDLLAKAKILEHHGEWNGARRLYAILVKQGVSVAEAMAGMGRVAEANADYDTAITYYQEALAYEPSLTLYQTLSRLYAQQNRHDESIEMMRLALGASDATPTDRFDILMSLGSYAFKQKNFAEAEDHFTSAYEIRPDSDLLHVNVGSLALNKNDLVGAETHFRKAIDINSANERAYFGLGLVFLAKRDFINSKRYFIESLNRNSDQLGAIYHLVKCSYETKHFDDAIRYLENYISNRGYQASLLYSLAGMYFHSKNFPLADRCINRILSNDPNHDGAHELKTLMETLTDVSGAESSRNTGIESVRGEVAPL